MDYQNWKQEIENIGKHLSLLISEAKGLSQEKVFRDWEKILDEVRGQLKNNIFRIAVVGTIKSGKSTFVNYLCCGDYLKRGAGVATSFITRVRRGKKLRAILKLKSSKEINREIENSINSISVYKPEFKELIPFEIKDFRKIEKLFDMIKKLDKGSFLKDGIQDLYYFTLILYLDGYEHLKDKVSDKNKTIVYEKNDFEKHKRFVGDDRFAIYLKDILVEVNSGIFDESVEIADCQGSDSPNPLHLLMIQEYLIGAHFIIYVISSRIGLREADMKFLNLIKKMGMIRNIVFIINCDFDEHKSAHEIIDIVDKTKDQLSLFIPNPQLFTFSALFNLFSEMKKKNELSKKEHLRFQQWKQEKELVELSNNETSRFLDYFKDTLSKQRYAIFIKGCLERLYLVALEMRNWSSFNMHVLDRNRKQSEDMVQKIKNYRFNLDKIGLLLKDTIDGASDKLKEEIRKEVDKFFDKNGKLLLDLKKFISQFQLPDGFKLQELNISQALYALFNEYKRAVDTFIVQNINPLIIKFIQDLDKKITDNYISTLKPFYEMINAGSEQKISLLNPEGIVDINRVKEKYNIKPPSIKATMEYNILLTSETMMKFGIYRFFNFIRRVFKKRDTFDERIMALEDGLKRIKRQGWNSLLFSLMNYKENLKYQYAFMLINSFKDHILDAINDQIRNSIERYMAVEEELIKGQIDKETSFEKLSHIKEELDSLIFHIEKLGNSGSFTHLLK